MDKKIIAANFSKKSQNYHQNSDIQKICAEKIVNFTKNYDFQNALDIGSGTGYIKNSLLKNDKIIELDISFEMLKKSSAAQKINADFSHLPLKKNSFEIIYSSFAFQWCDDLFTTFSQINKALKEGGIFAFSLPIYGSLKEIKDSNPQDGFFMLDFFKPEEISKTLDQSGFQKIEEHQEIIAKKYQNAIEVLKNIKSIGANYSNFEKKFISRKKIEKFNDFFATNHQNVANWRVGYFIYQKLNK